MRRSTLLHLAAVALLSAAPRPAAAVPVLPDFSSAVFDPAQPIDNPYFPMTDARTYVYRGVEDGEAVDERFEHTNTGPGPVIAGVQSFVQRDREFEDGLLVEETFDYFAQDTLGKVCIDSQDRAGFVVNALLIPYLLSAIRMYESGFASKEDIDEGMIKGCAHPMGPLALADLIGLDTLLAVSESLYDEFRDPASVAPALLNRMVEAGLLGRKSGRGFYDYSKS